MSHRFLDSRGALRGMIAVALLATVPVAGQSPHSDAKTTAAAKAWTPPRTADGQPDLQGIWTNTTLTPFERSKELAGKEFFTEQEASEYQKGVLEGTIKNHTYETPEAGKVGAYDNEVWFDRGTRIVPSRRTSLVVEPPDGRVPLTPAAEEKRQYNLAHQADSYEYQGSWIRCVTRGVPAGMFPRDYNNGYQILQTPGYVVILSEMIREARIIPLDGRAHVNEGIHLWDGDSRGRWEGNTLVVDTTNFNDKVIIEVGRRRGIPQSKALHVVERFTRMDPNTINYEVTIDDPNVYSKPWKVAVPFNRDETYEMFEYACHEGNYAMANILSGARAKEKAAAEEAAKKDAK
jgi:hypothetical protein